MRIQTKHQTVADRERSLPQLNLLVSGFNRQARVRVEQIAAAIDALPAFHLAGLDQIIYDPAWETRSGFALRQTRCPRRSKAVFLRGERKILVFGFDDASELEHILYHEIGHHIFDRVLDTRLRKKWIGVPGDGVAEEPRHLAGHAAQRLLLAVLRRPD